MARHVTAAPAAATPQRSRFLINRDFGWLWLGQTVSLFGDSVFSTTLLLWIAVVLYHNQAYAPLISSTVLVIVAAMAIVVSPLAGVLVDRYDKRRVMIWADLVRFGLIGLLTVVGALPSGTVGAATTLAIISVVVAMTTAAAGFFEPARLVLIGDIVPADRQGTASGHLQSAKAIASISGPPLAALLLTTVGVQSALGLNALSFAFSAVMIGAIRVHRGEPAQPDSPAAADRDANILGEFTAGIGLFRRNRMARGLLITSIIAMLGAGAINALDVFFVRENLGASAGWFGVIGGVFGVGMLAGSLLAGTVGHRMAYHRLYCGGLVSSAIFFGIYSRMTSPWPAVVLVLLFSTGLGALNTVFVPLLLDAVPRHFLGRVLSVFDPAGKAAAAVSIIVAGAIAGDLPVAFRVTVAGIRFGRIDIVFFCCAVMILAGGLYAVATVGRKGGSNRDDASTPRA